MMTQFEDKFMEVQASMVSLAFGICTKIQADKIYIHAIADSLYSFNLFYEIKGKVCINANNFLPDDSQADIGLQSILLKKVSGCRKH